MWRPRSTNTPSAWASCYPTSYPDDGDATRSLVVAAMAADHQSDGRNGGLLVCVGVRVGACAARTHEGLPKG